MKVVAITNNIIQKTVNDLVDFIKPTYGADGKKVIISKPHETIAIDDGVKIANEYDTNNQAERAVLKIIKQVSNNTNQRVGDGTTSSLLLLQGIMNEIYKLPDFDGRIVEQELTKALQEVKEMLRSSKTMITSKVDLKKVAMISFNNEQVAYIIADTLYKIGCDGLVTVDEHSSTDITSEIVDGQELASGWITPDFITDKGRLEAIVSDAYVFITDHVINKMEHAKKILDTCVMNSGSKNIFIIAEKIEGDALFMFILNKVKAGFNIVPISIQTSGRQRETLEDLATLTGATLLTKDKKIEDITAGIFGFADKVTAKQHSTLVIATKHKDKIEETITSLRIAITNTKFPYEKEQLEHRIAKLANGIARINVGAITESERTALKHKIEDSVNATKVAQKGGIVCGSGIALAELTTSSKILNNALKASYNQLRINSNITESLASGEAINTVTGEVGPFLEVGVIDPVEVLIAGVECAVSVANTLATTRGIIYQEDEQGK